MALEVLDPEETLKFYPEGEKGENPTIIHLKKSDVRDSLKWRKLYRTIKTDDGDIEIEFADDNTWFDYICARVKKIENIIYKKKLQTVEKPAIIRAILGSPMSKNFGQSLFLFLMENSSLTEEQAKN